MSMFADFKTADKAPSVNKAAAAASDRNANELAKYNDRKVKTNTAIGVISLINPWVGAALKAGEVATDEGADQEVVPLDSAAVRGEAGGEILNSETGAGLAAGNDAFSIGGADVDLGIEPQGQPMPQSLPQHTNSSAMAAPPQMSPVAQNPNAQALRMGGEAAPQMSPTYMTPEMLDQQSFFSQ